jgi:hypothetical protein
VHHPQIEHIGDECNEHRLIEEVGQDEGSEGKGLALFEDQGADCEDGDRKEELYEKGLKLADPAVGQKLLDVEDARGPKEGGPKFHKIA